ncbi:MAG: type II secretion system protein GspG [Candidatus Krumholzibacteriia bacterium]
MDLAFRKGFTRLETALGLCVVAGLLVVVLPTLWRGTGQDRQRSAVHRAENLAAAVLDYRSETGRWPEARGGSLDVTCLVEVPARRDPPVGRAELGGMLAAVPARDGDGAARPWLDAIPVDPWGRPYRVNLLGDAGERAVAVVSAGPDGVFQTGPERAAHGLAGDDAGIVLIDQTDGGSRP